jgi:CRP/FNR family cyclic AMP-dependent transcriptional regulator
MKVSTRNKHRTALKGIPFFSCFSDDDLSSIEQIITEKSVRKNDVILWEEETKDYMYIVFSGKIKVVQTGPEGKEQILVIRKKGDFFGEMALLDGKTQPATVVAMEDATVGLISKNDFETYFLKNDKVLRQIISLLCERLRESWLMLRVLSFDNAEQRVRAVLNNVSSLYGVKDTRGTIIPLKLTHQEIADYASLARETVSRLLSRFCQTGEIEILANKNIVLKPTFSRESTN